MDLHAPLTVIYYAWPTLNLTKVLLRETLFVRYRLNVFPKYAGSFKGDSISPSGSGLFRHHLCTSQYAQKNYDVKGFFVIKCWPIDNLTRAKRRSLFVKNISPNSTKPARHSRCIRQSSREFSEFISQNHRHRYYRARTTAYSVEGIEIQTTLNEQCTWSTFWKVCMYTRIQ